MLLARPEGVFTSAPGPPERLRRRRPGAREAATIASVIAQELLDLLVCPKCKQKVELSADGEALVCTAERLRYPIIDGIPVMLIDEAERY